MFKLCSFPHEFLECVIKIEKLEWLNICISYLFSPILSKLICIRIHLLSEHAQDLLPVIALGKQGRNGEEHLFAPS